MKDSFIKYIHAGLQQLKPYQPGKPIAALRRELGIEKIIKLASNENPLGPGAMAIAAATDAISNSHRYPDLDVRLKEVLAERLAVSTDRITLGTGSDNVLALIGQAFLQAGDEAIMGEYAFAAYPIITRAMNATPVFIPTHDWRHDLDAMLDAITAKTRIIFIANPNNPTGTWLTETELLRFLKKIPEQIIVVLDEAYYEYVTEVEYPNSIDFQQRFPNVITTRTFSKIHGLAGLRIGYGISHPDIADLLNRIRLPFNASTPALAAAIAALNDEAHIRRSLDNNGAGKQQLNEGLIELGLAPIPTVGNFMTVDFRRPAAPIYEQLLQKGLILRPLMPYKLPNQLRITIGDQNEITFLLQTLKKLL